ncbi:MAG: tRNA epoxyqueuosine(34) reductase QueG [Planctomycetota bacterium]|nr:MAG: tRNA epoxyqueuosine(34) reductase QueG [Planctomycetota bacterium]
MSAARTEVDSRAVTARLKEAARELGFTLAGACSAAAPPGIERFREWLARGYAGEMRYLAAREAAYADANLVLPGVRSVLMLALGYRMNEPHAAAEGQGRIARYAWGQRDYHDVIRERLHKLADLLRALVPGTLARGIVDTAPVLERQFAQRAGLGWLGKNTLLLNKSHGSWFFLAGLLTDVELAYDAEHETDHCGTCTACLDACPTQAFVAPYVLDARRCISYATIERRSLPETELRAGHGDWVFGCDVCQDVCPWNHRAPIADEPAFVPLASNDPVELAELLALDDAAFRRRFAGTPLMRPGRTGVLRSAAIALGNRPCAQGLEALATAIDDTDRQIRAAASWALGRYASAEARSVLASRASVEQDETVRQEIEAGLCRRGSN